MKSKKLHQNVHNENYQCQFQKAVNNIDLSHYSPMLLIYTPKNTRKPKGFLMFSGSIDKQHQAVMGWKIQQRLKDSETLYKHYFQK